MSRAGDYFVRCCMGLHQVPAAILCVLVYLIQAFIMDYFLVKYLGSHHFAWIAGDVMVLVLLVVSIVVSTSTLEKQKRDENAKTPSNAWIAWLVMHALLAAKVVISFLNFSIQLEESDPTFFGPNTLKTAIALGSCMFLLLLTTQHDAPLGSDRRRYIEALTGTVFFDLLDTADILEILFSEEDRALLYKGLEEAVLSVASFNLLLPTVPLMTLSRTKFGHNKLGNKMIYLHRVLTILAVNVPNLMIRMVLWHGFSVGISPFTLKNLILIVITLYEFYEHKLEKYELHRREREADDLETNKIQNDTRDLSMANSCDVGIGNSMDVCYVDIHDGDAVLDNGDGPVAKTTNISNEESESIDTSSQGYVTAL